jgi:hypothetical protein
VSRDQPRYAMAGNRECPDFEVRRIMQHHQHELRNPKDTRKRMILVRLWDLKFLEEIAAGLEELQIPPH